jgi:hypothetical protein
MDSERLLVATVAEDRAPYRHEVEVLFSTLRHFGGNLSNARCIAYFVRSAAPALIERLASLDVAVKIVEPVDERYVYANKIRMLDPSEDCDYLLALDNDIVVCRDFSDHISGTALAAKPVDTDPLGLQLWQATFEHFEVEFPLARFATSFTLAETIPYFNSGVVLIPRPHLDQLREQWTIFIDRILDCYKELPSLGEYFFVADQVALSLAIVRARLPYRALPLEMNFPTHRPVHASFGPERLQPYLLHHHHLTTRGGSLRRGSHKELNRSIAKVNRFIRGNPTEPLRSHA